MGLAEEVGTSGTRPAPEGIVGVLRQAEVELAQAKAEGDMGKAVVAPTGRPDAYRLVCRGDVSSGRGDAVAAAARRLDVHHVVAWSGAEFGENPRLRGEDLLRRFCAGEAFPDGAEELRRIVDDFPGGDRPEPGGHWTSPRPLARRRRGG